MTKFLKNVTFSPHKPHHNCSMSKCYNASWHTCVNHFDILKAALSMQKRSKYRFALISLSPKLKTSKFDSFSIYHEMLARMRKIKILPSRRVNILLCLYGQKSINVYTLNIKFNIETQLVIEFCKLRTWEMMGRNSLRIGKLMISVLKIFIKWFDELFAKVCVFQLMLTYLNLILYF